ncbi:MAG: hypothetical protein ABIL24_03425 [candidate division WOR-3 bacterium]
MKYKFLIVFILFSCVKLDNSNPTIYNYNVIAYMVSGNDTQLIFFDRTYKPTEEHHYGMEGANIIVFNKDSTYQFLYPKSIDTINYYYSVFNPKPSDTLFLKVITPTSETLYSKTYIPSDFQIIQPIENETILIPSNKLIIWTKSNGAVLYKLNAYKTLRDTSKGFQIPYLATDTFSDMFSYNYFFKDTGLYTISIMALNDAVSKYLNKGEGNVENAQGVFGGVVMKKVHVFIRTQ